jgi:succinyl-diaminopimelate desuccinylase
VRIGNDKNDGALPELQAGSVLLQAGNKPMKTLIDIFADLVAIPTVSSDSKANAKALNYIENFLGERGMHVKRMSWEGKESLVATSQPTKHPRIMLVSHIDVVPAPPRLFKLVEQDGKFYGRGTCDMKFAIAAYLQLVEELRENLSAYDFGIMVTTDEEVGGFNGTKKLLEAGYRADACVLPDGGDNWQLEQEAKGLLWVILTAGGKPAHGSRPWEGESAIEKTLLFLQSMQRELFAEQNNNTSTCNIGIIRGGSAVNQVASSCHVDVDVRTLNKEEHQRIVKWVEMASRKYDVGYELYLNDPPIEVDLADPFVIAYGNSIEKVTGRPLQTMKSNGGSDARFFARYNIPTLVAYPTGGGRHSDHEWLEVASFYQFRDVLSDYIEQTARLSGPIRVAKPLTSAQ